MPSPDRDIGLLCHNFALNVRAEALCKRFDLTRLQQVPETEYVLYLDNEGLELRAPGTDEGAPIQVDFVGGAVGHRLRFGGGRGQPLARAAGVKPGFDPVIWDATAGLGRDAFVLASVGCKVTLCERSPVLAALLDDGLKRATLNADIGDWVSARMVLRCADSTSALRALDEALYPDTVYLDPMYPPGKSSVLVKKEIRALQHLLGEDNDSQALFEAALAVARRRVVVKRPRRAGPLHDRLPSTSIESKKTRYDIYVTL